MRAVGRSVVTVPSCPAAAYRGNDGGRDGNGSSVVDGGLRCDRGAGRRMYVDDIAGRHRVGNQLAAGVIAPAELGFGISVGAGFVSTAVHAGAVHA